MSFTRRAVLVGTVSLIASPSIATLTSVSSSPKATPPADLLPDNSDEEVSTETWVANNGTMTVRTILAHYSDATAARAAFQALDADEYADSTGFMVSSWDDDVLNQMPEAHADAARAFQGDGPDYTYDWTVVALRDNRVAIVSMTGEWDSFSPQVLYDTATRLISGEAIDPPGYNPVDDQNH